MTEVLFGLFEVLDDLAEERVQVQAGDPQKKAHVAAKLGDQGTDAENSSVQLHPEANCPWLKAAFWKVEKGLITLTHSNLP